MSSRTSLSEQTRAAFSAHREKGAVAQLPKQSHVQSECHDSEMLHQVAGPNAKPQPCLCIYTMGVNHV